MVQLIAITQGAGELVNHNAQEVLSYITRVSAPENQLKFESAPKLLNYCLKHSHWSPFEHAYMTLQVETSRAIAAQLLRHRSFVFQEFSQRYAKASDYVRYQARRQDTKNRQNSIDDLDEGVQGFFELAQAEVWELAKGMYDHALSLGIAKECARFFLPMNTKTTVMITGNARSWIHYLQLRTDPATQLEHREIAQQCKTIFCAQFPDIAEALEWIPNAIEPEKLQTS